MCEELVTVRYNRHILPRINKVRVEHICSILVFLPLLLFAIPHPLIMAKF